MIMRRRIYSTDLGGGGGGGLGRGGGGGIEVMFSYSRYIVCFVTDLLYTPLLYITWWGRGGHFKVGRKSIGGLSISERLRSWFVVLATTNQPKQGKIKNNQSKTSNLVGVDVGMSHHRSAISRKRLQMNISFGGYPAKETV